MLAPGVQARRPAAHVVAIFVIGVAEFSAQRRLLVEDDKQMHAESDGRDCGDGCPTCASENNPEADPPRCEADIHRIAHVTVKAHHDQTLRRNKWSGGSAAGPAE